MDFLLDSPMWQFYLGVLLGPFIQEDTAVIAAASLSVTQMAKTSTLFILVTTGLFISDIWKYWIGWAALKNKSGRAFADKKHIANMGDKVLSHTFTSLIAARFIPMTRIPAYVACGFFGVPYMKYCLYILISAILYVAVIFSLFHALGEILGEKLLWIMPVIALLSLGIFMGSSWLKKRSLSAHIESHSPDADQLR